jgi:virulence-associated protein VagC
MSKERAKLFAHGGSQAVRLPKAFRFDGKEVSIRRDGDRVILEPVNHDPDAFWARIDACGDGDGSPGHAAFAQLAIWRGPAPDLDAAR